MVGVALASIQWDLRASLPDLPWVSAAHALVLPVLLLASSVIVALLATAAVAFAAGTRVAAAVTHAARAGTAGGLNNVLLAAAAFATLGAIAGFAPTVPPQRRSGPTSWPPVARPRERASAEPPGQQPAGSLARRHLYVSCQSADSPVRRPPTCSTGRHLSEPSG